MTAPGPTLAGNRPKLRPTLNSRFYFTYTRPSHASMLGVFCEGMAMPRPASGRWPTSLAAVALLACAPAARGQMVRSVPPIETEPVPPVDLFSGRSIKRLSPDPEFVDSWGPHGPSPPQTHRNRCGASFPTLFSGYWGGEGPFGHQQSAIPGSQGVFFLFIIHIIMFHPQTRPVRPVTIL